MTINEKFEQIKQEKEKFINSFILDLSGTIYLLKDIILADDEIYYEIQNRKGVLECFPAFVKFIFLKERLTEDEYHSIEDRFKNDYDYFLNERRSLIGEKVFWKGVDYFIMDVHQDNTNLIVIEDETFSVINLEWDDVILFRDLIQFGGE